MKHRSIAKVSWMIMTVILMLAEASLAQQKESVSALQQISGNFLGSWSGEGTAPDGQKFQSKLNFVWTLDKNFIKVENLIKSGDETSLFALTFYGWQPVLKQIVFWSFDRDGTINEGVANLDGNSLNHEWRSFSQNGEINEWRSTLTKNDSVSISFTITDVQSGESFSVHYKRKK